MGSPPKWLPGTVTEVTGPLSYRVELESGISVRRHVDSVRKRVVIVDSDSQSPSSSGDPLYLPDITPTVPPPPPIPPPLPRPLRRSTRPQKPLDRYGH